MFETLFTCLGAIRRHREGPLATERAAYLSELAAQGMARGTILRRSDPALKRTPNWHADSELMSFLASL